MGTYTIISLAIGFIIILFFGWIMYVHYTNDDLEHWVPPTLIVGMLIIMLFGSIGYGADKYEKIHGEIKNTITSNYDNVTNYHNDDRQSFVSGGIRYTFVKVDENGQTIWKYKKTPQLFESLKNFYVNNEYYDW